MAEILGVGVTHSPSLITPDELKNLADPRPQERAHPAGAEEPGELACRHARGWGESAPTDPKGGASWQRFLA